MIDLQKVKDAEIDFGLGNSDGHDLLMMVGPMVDEIRHLRARLDSALSMIAATYLEVEK
jgi:hypothetical protein